VFADLRSIDNDVEIKTDICIVGAGAAGVTLALQLIDRRIDVCLLESGGFALELDSQALYDGQTDGRPYYPLGICRLRFFGGTTNHWGGRSRPFSDWDFAPRARVPHSGWPITLGDLEPYYQRATAVCGLGPFTYGAEVWKQTSLDVPALDPQRLRYGFWQYSRSSQVTPGASGPVRFGKDYREALGRAQNISVLLHANLTGIRLDPSGGAVEAFEFKSLTGVSGRVRAQRFVLACGAIENARMLLLSNDIMPQGVGNTHDLVGRFFMEHPDSQCGILEASSSDFWQTFKPHQIYEREFTPGVLLAPEVQAREQVLGCAAAFRKAQPADAEAVLRNGYPDRATPYETSETETALSKVLAYFDSLTGDEQNDQRKGKPRYFIIAAELEQMPNPESRVTLTDEADALGLRRTCLAWRLTEQDKRSLLTFVKTIGLECGRLNLGRVRISEWLLDGDNWGGNMHGSYHHLGTTRMADQPHRGVVDRNCRVHGIENLYVAGGSVFPTASPTNPTFTIVALTIRLGDHLLKHFEPN
jgi:choline dehydrogenase-like flavoprotein